MDARRDDAVSTLIDLIACSREGEHACRTCADPVHGESLRQLLLCHAAECRCATAELSSGLAHVADPGAGR